MKFALITVLIIIVFSGGFAVGLLMKDTLSKLFNNIYSFIKGK